MGKKGNIICVGDTPNQQMTVKKDKSERKMSEWACFIFKIE
jgi:PhoPQ-activated pathogenicity-related protein